MRESIFAAIILLIPAACVWRFNRMGILLGALTAWLIGLADALWFPELDPESGSLNALWIRYGWATMLLYATVLFIVKWAYRKVRPLDATPPH